MRVVPGSGFVFFFFNDTATTEIYTLSLHDALPIYARRGVSVALELERAPAALGGHRAPDQREDRKSTRLNSSHLVISYAVFCLKKKKKHATCKFSPSYQRGPSLTSTRPPLPAHPRA